MAATWGKRGPEIVRRNVDAIDAALGRAARDRGPGGRGRHAGVRRPAVPDDAPDFVQRVTRLLLEGHGDRLPVSAFPPDGTWPTGTSRYEKRAIALEIPIWEPDLCVQCNRCSMICPHTAIRHQGVRTRRTATARPASFRSEPEGYTPELEGLSYTVQVAPDDCTGCGLCVEVCPAKDRTQPKRKAINMRPVDEHRDREREAFDFFAPDPRPRPHPHPAPLARTLALLPATFEFSGACAGCGETPYIRVLTQLFGDRLVIANATGCSSIYGGNLPTTPYTTGADGRGPAWSNSLFEDNAEFGLGLRLGLDARERRARALLATPARPSFRPTLVAELIAPVPPATTTPSTRAPRRRRRAPRPARRPSTARRRELGRARPTRWCPARCGLVGGDGWAYDIGYGGLDHVLASNRDVNVLVLDTEVYSNTGGQQSKATPLGAVAKFASAGKETRKKDLGLLAMSYGHVYVASVAMQARSRHTLKAARRKPRATRGRRSSSPTAPASPTATTWSTPPPSRRRAINSGAWPLYRFDPRRIAAGEPPLVIDADPTSVSMREYMEQEARFRMVEMRDPERFTSARPRRRGTPCATATPSTSSSPRSAIPTPEPTRSPTMVDLTTTWLGLELRSPFVVGASPLADDVAGARATSSPPAPAPSCCARCSRSRSSPSSSPSTTSSTATSTTTPKPARSCPTPHVFAVGAEPDRRATCERVRAAVDVPVVASLNGVTPGGWTDIARQLADAGADAIELNLYDLATDLDETSADIEDRQLAGRRRRRRHRRHPGHGEAVAVLRGAAQLRRAASNDAGAAGVVRVQPLLPTRHRPRHPRRRPPPAPRPPRPSSRCASTPSRCSTAASALSLAATGGVHSGTRRGQGHPVRRRRPSRSCPRCSTAGPATLARIHRELDALARRDGLPHRRRSLRRDGARQRRRPPRWERLNYARLLHGWQPRPDRTTP